MAEAPPGGWLFKQEPSCYSFDQLLADGETAWDGVANNTALKHLRNVKAGDRVLFYHTGKEKAIVGEMKVVAGPDDQAIVTVKAVRRWPRPVTLAEMKSDPSLVSWDLIRISRLSVLPVPPEVWSKLESWSARPPAFHGS